MKKVVKNILFLVLASIPGVLVAQTENVSVEVDLSRSLGEMRPIWAWFGYDEPNYTYMTDGAKLLTELSELSYVPVHVRTHNLLTSGDGTADLKWGSTNAYVEDADGNPIYDWSVIDRIFDTYVERGMKPLVEIGFMPEALTTGPEPYRHDWTPSGGALFTGWTHPPRDYDKWSELVRQWALHMKERYGEEEVLSWYWEVWNEPDIGYWSGSFEEYCKLYDYAAYGLKQALPKAKIGGPHTTDPSNRGAADYLRRFLEHCISGTNYATGTKGSPLDYVGFHAKGSPTVIDGHVRMNLGRQLRNVQTGCDIVRSFPELKDIPIIIGESDPEGCAACSIDHHPQNAYRNGTMFSSYVAAAFAKKYEIAARTGANIEGAVSWAFEFEDQPWFAGFRDLATNGVDKPVLNVFRMYGRMKGELVEAGSSYGLTAEQTISSGVRGQADIGVLASRTDNGAAVMVWNYHDDDLLAEAANIMLKVDKVGAGRVLVSHYRIDAEHSNSYELWKNMGHPQHPTPEQYSLLERKGGLEQLGPARWMDVKDGVLSLDFSLPRQGVSLIEIGW